MLAAVPQSHDPFVLEETPNVLVFGNQKQFETHLLSGSNGQQVRIICIPPYSATPSLTLLNLRTLACRNVLFQTYDD